MLLGAFLYDTYKLKLFSVFHCFSLILGKFSLKENFWLMVFLSSGYTPRLASIPFPASPPYQHIAQQSNRFKVSADDGGWLEVVKPAGTETTNEYQK